MTAWIQSLTVNQLLLVALAFGVVATLLLQATRDWLMMTWRFGQCDGCQEWRCPRIGKLGARRRQSAYCPKCSDLFDLNVRPRR